MFPNFIKGKKGKKNWKKIRGKRKEVSFQIGMKKKREKGNKRKRGEEEKRKKGNDFLSFLFIL